MELKQIKEKKKEIETTISQLLFDFEEETQVKVLCVHIDTSAKLPEKKATISVTF